MKPIFLLLSLVAALGFSSCARQVKAKHPVSSRFQSGRTAMLKNGVPAPGSFDDE